MGANEEELGFGRINSKSIKAEPGMDDIKSRGQRWKIASWVQSGKWDINLRVIGIKIKLYWRFRKNVTNGCSGKGKEKRTKNQSLYNASDKWSGAGTVVSDVDVLRPVGEVRGNDGEIRVSEVKSRGEYL